MTSMIRSIVETDDNRDAYVQVPIADDGYETKRVPLRLRAPQHSLGPLFAGHEVTNLEWIRGEEAMPPTREPDWVVLAEHDGKTCPRCRLWAEAEHRNDLPLSEFDAASKKEESTEGVEQSWDALADRAQAFYQDYIVRWIAPDASDPSAVNPMLDQHLRRERARVCADTAQMREWLTLAVRYVHARMHAVWIEEEALDGDRQSLQMFGNLNALAAGDDADSAESAGFVRPANSLLDDSNNHTASRTLDLRRDAGELRKRLEAVTRDIRGA